ncbi:glucose PTS transporter subunit EIIB [Pantoea sp. B65]|uniref:glucose PTS transporter subunit EIIB n=1 Tax=Pantoea sp. B65 TaxID=2813359 RepID=UPI0039B60F0F
MVSLKSFIHYFSQQKTAPEDNSIDSEYLQALMQGFGGRDNIIKVDACITRLRVTVKNLAQVDSEGLQRAGALGVIILGQEVHAIFGTQSDNLRKLLEKRFSVKD